MREGNWGADARKAFLPMPLSVHLRILWLKPVDSEQSPQPLSAVVHLLMSGMVEASLYLMASTIWPFVTSGEGRRRHRRKVPPPRCDCGATQEEVAWRASSCP